MDKESLLKEALKEAPFTMVGVVLPVVVAAGKVAVDKLTGAPVDLSGIGRDLAAIEGFLTIPLGLTADIARETVKGVRASRKK